MKWCSPRRTPCSRPPAARSGALRARHCTSAGAPISALRPHTCNCCRWQPARLGFDCSTSSAPGGSLLFAGYATALFGLLAPPTWLLAVAQSNPARAWAICRASARALLALTGMTPRVEGLQNIPAGACVIVSNHGSYLDGVVLVAVLPRPCDFIAKAELRQQRIAGPFLRRLGAGFVQRFDLRRAVQDAQALTALARRGHALVVFPEGTFRAAPGLLPFHLGAFLAAAQAQVPVVPLVLRGSRAALPDGSWRPRRARLEVHVLPPLPQPGEGDLFARAVRLRDAAYTAIAGRLEPAQDAP